MRLLKESLAGVGARFHLIGLYTLLEILLRIVVAEANDSPEWSLLFVLVLLTALFCSFGILGMIFHTATGRADPPSFAETALLLFPPLLWLQIKIAFLAYGPVLAGVAAWHAIAAPGQAIETWMPKATWWVEPIPEAITLVLTVYCTPVAILLRERRLRGAPVRGGLRVLRAARGAPGLLLLLLPNVVLGAADHFAHPPGQEEPVPDVARGIGFLLLSWLTLAAFYGASRLVARPPAAPPDADAEREAAAPGPPA